MNLIAVVAVVSNSRALLQEWHRIPLVRSIRAHFAEEAPVLTKRGRPVPPPVVTESVVPYELGLSFIALCLCVVLAVLVERRATRAPGRAAGFHALRALVVFSTLAVPLALCGSGSGVLTVSRRWRGRMYNPQHAIAAMAYHAIIARNTGAAPRPRGPCPTPSLY